MVENGRFIISLLNILYATKDISDWAKKVNRLNGDFDEDAEAAVVVVVVVTTSNKAT